MPGVSLFPIIFRSLREVLEMVFREMGWKWMAPAGGRKMCFFCLSMGWGGWRGKLEIGWGFGWIFFGSRTFAWSQNFFFCQRLEKDEFRLELGNLITSNSLWGSIADYLSCSGVAEETGMRLNRHRNELVITVFFFFFKFLFVCVKGIKSFGNGLDHQ